MLYIGNRKRHKMKKLISTIKDLETKKTKN